MLNNYLDDIIADVKKRHKDDSIDKDQYRKIYRAEAVRDLKWYLINEQLRKQEKFEATDEDVEAKLAQYSELGDDGAKRADEIRNNPQELERLKDSIISDKLYAFLADKAHVTQITKPWRELHEPPIPQETADADTIEDIDTIVQDA